MFFLVPFRLLRFECNLLSIFVPKIFKIPNQFEFKLLLIKFKP